MPCFTYRLWRWATAFAASLCLASASHAQSDLFPSQPVRMVVGFPAGGPTDVVARLIADSLSRSIGQPVLVDNKPGANATIAAEQVARAKPDGYTILMAATNHSINAVLYKTLKFDTEKAFAPVTAVAVAPTVLVVNPKFPAKNYAEFVALMKSHPGKYSYASAGSGGTPHLSAEMFKILTHTAIVHIPYRGAAPAVTDLIGGQVDMMFATLGSVLPQLRAGQLRAIAVAAPQRSRLLPNVPTFEESGLKGFRLDSWYGLLVPAGTPKPVVDRLHTEIVRAVSSAAYQERLNAAGLEPVIDSNPTRFAEQIRTEIANFGGVVRANKLTID
ncbi:tripartite tricarboxylate transporter substrate binding protein [Cupriavidus basilensis]|uniref:Tripartite tricarboxylate transporter substrate binding protein n=1 Tax=Cupriavidus basilensis TaxID=68895 RepID=A0ABT6AP33_9BURK|nr:tripartite tricarboxylate transporter substrate binding protein [Cupriavidus basilensis]MDF3834204.1 tripartite tricarboxylate transporter substrate binding protein [Cupriavidus basilensis]